MGMRTGYVGFALIGLLAANALAAPGIKAGSAILLDADTGEVLLEKSPDAARSPASTTKIMTALLLIENAPLDAWVTASKSVETVTGSSLHLRAGERISVRDLLYAILLRSANDACVAAAEYVSGSIAAFAEKMNQRAADLGMKRTNFANPHGLTDPLHYTTARDLAVLTRHAMENPTFAEIARTPKMWVNSRSLNRKDLLVRSHNKLLGKYAGLDGVKTGYTRPAGRCFVGSATRGGWRLVSVVMKSPNWQEETKALLDYGFKSFQRKLLAPRGQVVGEVMVSGASRSSVQAVLSRDLRVALPIEGKGPLITLKPVFYEVAGAVSPGQVVGTMEIRKGPVMVAGVPLVAKEGLTASTPLQSARRIGWPAVVAAVVCGLVVMKRRNG